MSATYAVLTEGKTTTCRSFSAAYISSLNLCSCVQSQNKRTEGEGAREEKNDDLAVFIKAIMSVHKKEEKKT